MGNTTSSIYNDTNLNEHLVYNMEPPIQNTTQQTYYSVDYNSNTLLILATKYGYKDIVQCLLNNGANPNEKTVSGKTALTYAIEYNDTDIVRLLINYT